MRRTCALVVMAVLAAMLAAVGVPVGGPAGASVDPAATAAGPSGAARLAVRPVARRTLRSRPHLAVPRQTATQVVFRGVSRPRHVVRLQVWSGARWTRTGRTRADRRGRFRVTVAKPTVTRTYRVRSFDRSSVQRVVVPTFDACGVRPRKEDGSLYSCTLAENFSGTTLNPKLWARYRTPANWGYMCIDDDPRLSYVANGFLNLSVARTGGTLQCQSGGLFAGKYAGATVTSYERFSQEFGRFEARMKSPPVPTNTPGLHEAFWLWPDYRYGPIYTGDDHNEIDVSELYSVESDLAIPFLHYSGGSSPKNGINTAWTCTAHRGVWNTYTLDWTPTKVVITVNGKVCLTSYEAAPHYHQRFFINLSQHLGSTNNAYDGRAPVPSTTLVDYVKVWR